ncbi:hypothetical protein [Streptomyces decoyicus]|uniref:hypothetical protein n=1 Tax=Streptomyces decoyicus TaxID=249567 RepID=UPI003F4C0A6C
MTRSAPGSRDDGGYLLDNAQPEAGTRFDALSELFDPTTFRHIEGLGIAAGWQCWEIGAGDPSVVTWLADRVGRTGRVLATDIDTSWASQAAGEVVEVLRHDVGQDEPPASGWWLIAARSSTASRAAELTRRSTREATCVAGTEPHMTVLPHPSPADCRTTNPARKVPYDLLLRTRSQAGG